MKPYILNHTGTAICRASILSALMHIDLHWEMNPAQLFSLEVCTVDWSAGPLVVEKMVSEQEDKLMCELIPATKYTLSGVPIIVRHEIPETWIRLMQGKKEIARIEALAVPSLFCSWQNYDAHQKSEDEKARVLCQEQQELS